MVLNLMTFAVTEKGKKMIKFIIGLFVGAICGFFTAGFCWNGKE